MKRMVMTALIPFILTLGACTIHVPFDTSPEYDFQNYRIVFEVDPDDALILLDGRAIGEAYEFSTPQAALQLRGNRHEIVIKREGYIEELINLRDYAGGRITIRRRMRSEAPRPGMIAPPAAETPEAKTVEPKPLPDEEAPLDAEPAAADVATDVQPVTVTLQVQPEEAAIYLEGRFWGIAPPSGKIDNLRLLPGNYTIEVARPGYASFKQVLQVKDKPIQINIALKKE